MYACGATSGAHDVWCALLSTGGANTNWSVGGGASLPGVPPSPINDVCADGDYVYVVTDNYLVAAGSNASLFCLDRFNGTTLWYYDIDGADINKVSVDDEYIYCLDSTNNYIYVVRKGSYPGIVARFTDLVDVAQYDSIPCDGVSVYASVSGTPADIKRFSTLGATKTFMRVEGDDPARRPFYTLAIPIDKRT